MSKDKELQKLYKMLGSQNLSGTETFKDHLNDLSSNLIRKANNAASKENPLASEENKYHKGRAKSKTESFMKHLFKLHFLNILRIEEISLTNDRIYAIAIIAILQIIATMLKG